MDVDNAAKLMVLHWKVIEWQYHPIFVACGAGFQHKYVLFH